jgi:hypothetical protein
MILPYKNIWQLEKDKSDKKYNELVESTKQTAALLEKLQKENVFIVNRVILYRRRPCIRKK